MNKLIFLLLITSSLFAQYSHNIDSTWGEFEGDVGYSNYGLEGADVQERSLTRAHSGTYSRHVNVDAASEGFSRTVPWVSVTAGDVYQVKCWVWVNTGGGNVLSFENNNRFGSSKQILTTTTNQWTQYTYGGADLTVAVTGVLQWVVRSNSAASEFYFDDLTIRKRLTTLYIDASLGDDNNMGNASGANAVKTLAHGIVTRGVYSTGVFDINGTFAESITMPGDFGTLQGSGTVTQIDFNSVTGTVDLGSGQLTITTALNDDNITYLNPDTGQDKGFKEHSKFKRFKGLK